LLRRALSALGTERDFALDSNCPKLSAWSAFLRIHSQLEMFFVVILDAMGGTRDVGRASE
jgi:hypothetical protein